MQAQCEVPLSFNRNKAARPLFLNSVKFYSQAEAGSGRQPVYDESQAMISELRSTTSAWRYESPGFDVKERGVRICGTQRISKNPLLSGQLPGVSCLLLVANPRMPLTCWPS